MSAIESPCIDVCRMNPHTRLCDGCARTLREIGSWGQLTSEQRRAVMAQLSARRAALEEELPARRAAGRLPGLGTKDPAATRED